MHFGSHEGRKLVWTSLATGVAALVFVAAIEFGIAPSPGDMRRATRPDAAGPLGGAVFPTAATTQTTTPYRGAQDVGLMPRPFAEARECLVECQGKSITFTTPRADYPAPYQFSDLLKNEGANEAFGSLIAELPAEYAPLARRSPNDSPALEMGGGVAFVVKWREHVSVIYTLVGLPEGLPSRYPPGNLTVAVDPDTKEMAGVWTGGSDLSEYRFLGSEKLLPFLVAYIAADEAETERAWKISTDEKNDPVVFPVSGQKALSAETRLTYLASLYHGGLIRGAKSAFYAGDEARARKSWYAINVERTGCVQSISPADRIQQIREVGLTPTTEDSTDSQGDLVKIEVSYSRGWTTFVNIYYRDKALCIADLAIEQRIPDRYR